MKQAAMNLAQQGIGAYQPFLDAASRAQAAALGTTGAGVQTLANAILIQQQSTSFHGPLSTSSYKEALKEIDRQQQMAETS